MEKRILIKQCFFLKDGKCMSPEIYRKVNGMETGDACPFDPEEWAFNDWKGIKPDQRLRCLEFRHEHSCSSLSEKTSENP
jgi:hypothetical protein